MPWWGYAVIAVPVLMILVIFIGGGILWFDAYAKRNPSEPDPRDMIR